MLLLLLLLLLHPQHASGRQAVCYSLVSIDTWHNTGRPVNRTYAQKAPACICHAAARSHLRCWRLDLQAPRLAVAREMALVPSLVDVCWRNGRENARSETKSASFCGGSQKLRESESKQRKGDWAHEACGISHSVFFRLCAPLLFYPAYPGRITQTMTD